MKSSAPSRRGRMAWLSWRLPCYLAALAAVEIAVDVIGRHSTLGSDDPIGTAVMAWLLMSLAAGAVAFASAARSGPRWTEWAVAVAIFVIGAGAVETVWINDGVPGDFLSQWSTSIILDAVIYVSGVATGLALALAWVTRPARMQDAG